MIHRGKIRIAVFSLTGTSAKDHAYNDDNSTYFGLGTKLLDVFRVRAVRYKVTPSILKRYVEQVSVL